MVLVAFLAGLPLFTLACGPAVVYPPALIPITTAGVDSIVAAGPDGEVVLVNVWASWCEPCMEEIPALVNLARRHDNLKVVLVSADDSDDTTGAVIPTLEKLGVDFSTFFLADDQNTFMTSMHSDWAGALPATFIYKGGELAEWFVGGKSLDRFDAALGPLLAR